MLSLGQQAAVESLADDVVDAIRDIIKTKPIKRTSVRTEKGRVTTRTFSSTANSSGNLIKSLYYEITKDSIKFFGEEYIYTLIYGRPETKRSGSGHVKDQILKWIYQKGIVIPQGMKAESLAFLISRKIHRYGNSVYLSTAGQNNGLLKEALNKQIIEAFNKRFTTQLKDELADIFHGK